MFEDTALFARTSGAGSDVVQKEMYTFSDRSDRSLTLRPEGTAPICRAYVEHGMHREPQPVKLFTIASMYRYGAPGEAAIASTGRRRRGDRHRRSRDRRRAHPALRHAPREARRDALPPRAQLDRVPRVSARLPRVAPRVARDQRRAARRRDAREGRRQPAPRLRQLPRQAGGGSGGARRGAEDRRVAVQACVEHFAVVRADLDAMGVAYVLVPTLVRGLDYYSRTTFEFIGPTENQNPRSRAAAATTTSSRRSAARRHRDRASVPGSSGC